MITNVSHITVLVEDQEEALAYYTQTLGFEKKQDQQMETFRWLVVGPKEKPLGLILMLAETEREKALVGRQTGGRYSLFVMATNDCHESYASLKEKGVVFIGEPMQNPWGIAVQFKDLYGNKIDLVERS
ncbi:MAG: VOC family protein [Candidatus Woesearchaeota archaeon]|nr:MAG: VOC family protein [Candidatus Woesearchaeota archaeon]